MSNTTGPLAFNGLETKFQNLAQTVSESKVESKSGFFRVYVLLQKIIVGMSNPTEAIALNRHMSSVVTL